MSSTTGSSSEMRCAFCTRPMGFAVWIGSLPYHEECTHGPGYQAPRYAPLPVMRGAMEVRPVTEVEVRRIVAEELNAASDRMLKAVENKMLKRL